MRRNYTIAGLKSIDKYEGLDIAQFTINGRQFPGTRKTVEHLKELRALGNQNDIIVHWDFIYIVSRYSMFKETLKSKIISEIVDLINYAETDSHILGIVMHTDWPIKKEFFKAEDKAQFITDSYTGAIWDTGFIKWVVDNNEIENLMVRSITEFAGDLSARLDYTPRCKVHLENTTKVGPNGEGRIDWISSLFTKYPWINSVLGICYDSEHNYAVKGNLLGIEEILNLKDQANLIVHLNTIPEGVEPGSGKDRHSETTIYECSVRKASWYEEFANELDKLGIPWVREVKEEALLREINHE